MHILRQLSNSDEKHLAITHFDAFQDGVLTERETAVYRQHLATCPECQIWVEIQQQITQQLRGEVSPTTILPQAAAARIEKNISSQMRRAMIINNMKTFVSATAVIAVLAIIVGFFLWQNIRPDTQLEPMASQSDTVEQVAPTASQPDTVEKVTNEQIIEAVIAKDTAAVAQLLEAGISPNIVDSAGDPVLKLAINGKTSEDIDIIALLIEHGADVNVLDRDGNALLPIAARGNKLDVVQLLLDAGADINSTMDFTSLDGTSALMEAANGNYVEVAKLLIAHDADVNQTDRLDRTALHGASWFSHSEMVRLLIESGSELNPHSTYNDETPLHFAIRQGSPEVVEILVNAGVDVDIQINQGITPLMTILELGRAEEQAEKIVTLLLEGGANPNLQDNNGYTALHEAVRFKRIYAIPILLEHGASLDLKNIYGDTALAIAKDDIIIEMLREANARK